MNPFEYLRLGLKYRQDPLHVTYLMGRRVLDVGCGAGDFLARDADRRVGIDINDSLVQKCQDRGLDAKLGSAFSLPFADASFDAVHAAQLVEHLSPNEAVIFLGECARVLVPNGVVFLTTPGVRNVWNTFSHIRPYPPMAFRKLLRSETEAYIQESKLDLVFEDSWGTRRYSKNRACSLIMSAGDIAFPSQDPIGWTIVLRRPLRDVVSP